MLDFSSFLNLPIIWGMLLGVAVIAYAVLDGFDLGCGILYKLAPSEDSRDKIMNSIIPFWDGNETWIVLSVGILWVAFPPAYGIILSALYFPVLFMLVGIIFRGIAFEFRSKAVSHKQKKIWNNSFCYGSTLVAFMQGTIAGNFMQGFEVTGRSFSGSPFAWINLFSFFCGITTIVAYAFIASGWIVTKTEGQTQAWARGIGKKVVTLFAVLIGILFLLTPVVSENIRERYFSPVGGILLTVLGIAFFGLCSYFYKTIQSKSEFKPFFISVAVFVVCHLSFITCVCPWIIPFAMRASDAAAVSTSLSLLLIGAVIVIPIILSYTTYLYWVFRGKADSKPMY